MSRVTENFTTDEFACKDGTPYPRAWIDTRLLPLCAEVLQPVRNRVGASIPVLSGFRTDAYNRKIGGARLSQHVQGRAADLRPPKGWTAARLHALILEMYNDGELPRLGGLGLYPGFVHVDVRPGAKLARWTGGRTATETVA